MINCICQIEFWFPQSWKFFSTSLRLFVKEKYLRSRKAPRDYPKNTQNLKNTIYSPEIDDKWPYNRHKVAIMINYICPIEFWFPQSWNLFWQVSDCLSRKNIWDPARHLVIIQIIQIPNNTINHVNWQ